ncbi:MAG: glutathione-disulfide reductase [Gammaproteobacteria bacterium]|nr:glutathione-disulfide reductase [Gammaproteobacteria bacterium]
MTDFDYDLFVIGGGSGGIRASRIASSMGARVAIAESRYLGGTCVNVGCIPKKLLSYAAHYSDDFEDARGYGWNITDLNMSWQTLLENKNQEISRLNNIYKRICDSNNVSVLTGTAYITGPNSVLINDEQITAKYLLIATGGWPWVPEYEGSENVITSNEVFSLETLPKRLLVVGGGYIAVEFASIFSRLGCETTLSYRGGALLNGFDHEIRQFVTNEIGKELTISLNSNISKIVSNNNELRVIFKSGAELDVDLVVSATGRKPLTLGLGLENVGVEQSENGAVKVNSSFQTSEPSIYAIGDVIDRVALTPVALAEGQIVARHLFDGDTVRMGYENIPTAVFCHPNVATVGLTEQQAMLEGLNIRVFTSSFKELRHTLTGRDQLTMIKIIVDSETDKVIGLHMVGSDAGELVQGFTVAMNAGATKADFDRTLGIHPTSAEEFVTLRESRSGIANSDMN